MPTFPSVHALLLAIGLAMPWVAVPVSSRATPSEVQQEVPSEYTVQTGDTLTRIAKRFGLSAADLLRANTLEHPDRLAAGHVLRLPVNRSDASQAEPMPTITATPPPAVRKTPKNQAPAEPAPLPLAPFPPNAAPEETVLPPATESGPVAEPGNGAQSLVQRAVGVYAHPTLGTIRLAKGPNGLLVTRDNTTIAMRHLLYATFDGSDPSGIVHSVHLEFNARGDVESLQYSTSGTGAITFTRVRK